MRSLDDQAVFMGRNHPASVLVCDLPGCEENSVYFTDDYWERMNENDLYGGHDMGVYNLKGQKCQTFLSIGCIEDSTSTLLAPSKSMVDPYQEFP
ncbi:hypothetical protein OIU84_014762 [Salix udensis]|uniref:KIB1-4 beta-propeller domain-containing protein n=1 Tax=Salix udensis TaxID=889485 RepID=A0AAD6NRS5_9ROSI|nr:hypothetical protein OIU84_014762 [Salix udensis]